MLIPDPSPALALQVAEALERRRIAATVNGGVPLAGLVEIRDLFLNAVKGRQEPTDSVQWLDVLEAATVTPRLLKATQVATVLACSERTVERLIAAREIPTVRLGEGAVRVRAEDLDAYVASLVTIDRKVSA